MSSNIIRAGHALRIAIIIAALVAMAGGAGAVTINNESSVSEILARDTWNYFKTFNENNLPLNWYRLGNNETGKYFNPAEVGFYALSPILTYDMGLDCDEDGIFEPRDASLQEDDWDCSVNRTYSTLNRIEALFTYQQSAHDIWKLGDNEAPPDSPAAFDEFNQTKPFNQHYYIGAPVSDFPKEINDGNFTQIYIHFNLTDEEADNEQILFLDTLYATHDNVPYFNLRIKVGRSVDNLSYLGEYKFGSDGNYPEERYVAVPEKYLEPGENVLFLQNANPTWSGYWLVWDSLRIGELKKAYYQSYDMNGHVGSGQNDKLVPSIDNAWLVASLITIREYARANGEYNLSNQSDSILKGIDFTMWYNYTDHRFFWGDITNPKGGAVAGYYSDENRIINFLARALGQINQSEFQASLNALNQTKGSYGDIMVDKVNLDGSYFTYASPALFIREKDTSYAQTLENATWAQIKYAEDKGYPCWGISDAISPIDPIVYLNLGAPPAAGGYNDLGILTPHASALALVNKNPELLDRAIANLECLKNYSDLYDSRYGFRDSINVSDNVTSTKFLTLDQEWTFLSLANYKNNTIWKYFYRDNGVKNAHKEMYGTATWTVDDISGFSFQPQTINVAAGTTVIWTNLDSEAHTVTSDTGLFDSGSLSNGQTFSRTFNVAGNYDYHCSIHPSMAGRVAVSSAAVTPTPTPSPTPTPTPSEDVVSRYAGIDGIVQKSEAVRAVVDYFSGTITKLDAIQVVLAYFNG